MTRTPPNVTPRPSDGLIDHDNRDDAMTSVRLTRQIQESDLGLKEHTMGQVIAKGSKKGYRR
jgi:hypothetical protein